MSSVIINREESYFFSSNNTDQNSIVSNDGSTLTLSLDNPIGIPSSAVNATVEVQQANIWHTIPNISELKKNNQFNYSINGVAQEPITIEEGLYSLDSLSSYLSRIFVNRGQESTLVKFLGNNTTQRSIVILKSYVQVDFTGVNSVGSIMGFDARVVPETPSDTDGYSEEGDSVATFNETNSFAVKSDLVSTGVPVNNTGLNLLAVIPITSKVGYQNHYTPNHPIKVDARELRGKSRGNFYIQIANEKGHALPQNEPWSILVVFKYSILLTNEKVPMMDM